VDPQPRLELAELVRSQGPELYQDARRVRALLSDACPGSRAEIAVLVAAVEEDMPQRIIRSSDSLAIEGTIERLTGELAQSRGLSLEAARWSLQSWAWALGASARPPQDAGGQPAAAGAGQAPSWDPQPPGYGTQSSGPGTQPPGYGTQPPGYGSQPPAYGTQPPAYGTGGQQTESSATASLAIAIIGLFVCGIIGGIIAIIMANNAQKKIEASGGRLGGLSQAKAARIIGIIDIVGWAVFILLVSAGS
jgi:hypothetical protein